MPPFEAGWLCAEDFERFRGNLKHLLFIPPKSLLFTKIVYLCGRFLCFVLAEGNRDVFPVCRIAGSESPMPSWSLGNFPDSGLGRV